MVDSEQLSRIEGMRRLAREKQDQIAKCSDPAQRIVLLRERNALLAKLRELRRTLLPKARG